MKETLERTYLPIEVTKGSTSKCGIRHLQAFLLFLSFVVTHGIRAAMGVTLVAMTMQSSSNPDIQTHNWDKKTQDIVMSSFFWGYIMMQLPAGQISIKYGGKIPLTIALITNGLLSFFIPLVANVGGWKATCAIRVLQGLSQAVLMPCSHCLLGRWAPAEERARFGTFVYGGAIVGSVVFMALAGLLSATTFGWPSVFYTLGGLALLTGTLWYIMGANSPSEHPYITEEEKYYIEMSIGRNSTKKLSNVPWRAILTSVPVWALCFAHIGESWGQNTLISQTPAYMFKVMKVNIKESGSLSALPFVGKWIALIMFGYLFDYLVNRGFLSRGAARKWAQTIGSWPVAVGLIMLAFAPHDIIYVEVMLIVLCSLFSGTSLGSMINHLDLSPNYSGTLMSLSNFCAHVVSIFAPITAGLILTDDDTSIVLWRMVFFVAAGMHFVTNLVYIILGSAEIMPWDDPDYIHNKVDSKTVVELVAVREEKLLNRDLAEPEIDLAKNTTMKT